MIISQNQFDAVERLYKRGLNLQAYNLAQSIAPLEKWEGTDARLLAANLAYNLGAPEKSYKWTQNIWRKDKNHPKATLYYALDLLHSKGALPTLHFARTKTPDFGNDLHSKIGWNCLFTEIFTSLHDFETAEKWLNKAFEIDQNYYWTWVTKSHFLHEQDLYQESLAAAHNALKVGGWRRSPVLSTAHELCLLEKYNDALNLLNEATKHLESGWIIKELADLQSELGQNAQALTNYEKLLDFMPMREEKMEQWLYGRLSTIAYLAGNNEKGIKYAELSATPLSLEFKEKLKSLNGTEKRVQIKIGFIRQHEMTCAPATLSNISRYWNKKAEHLEIAEEICYGGTSARSERSWAEKNGYKVKEFTINWENVVQLIDRRIPITLATIHPGNGHLQAIIGYDEIRKTFLIRDPYYQQVEEFLVDELLESQKSNGPRGMALVPNEYAHLFNGIELKESRQHDFLFHIEDALEKHNRFRAVELLERMKQEFPKHLLTWRASWVLANYDANHLQILEIVENLRKEFPDDINLKMSYLSVSHGHLRHEEMLKLLEDFSKSDKSHPLLWHRFGSDLSLDARQHGRALRWLYRAMRCMPTNPSVYRAIANVFWSKRRFEEAFLLYRFAACLNDKDEQNAWSYFLASQHLEQTEKALQFLKDRFTRFGHRSSSPAQTLFQALRQTGLNTDAFKVLEEALQKRPDDAELKIFVAEAKARFGLIGEAKKFLVETEKQSSRREWLRTSATIAELEGELKTALTNWQEILQFEPLAMDAHQNVAFLLASTESRNSAQDYLKQVAEKFPHHREIHKYLLEWMNDEEPKKVLPIVQHLIEIDDKDSWSHRELARWLVKEKRFDEALSAVDTAFQLDSQEPVTHYVRGTVLTEMNRRPEAIDAFKQALTLSIDFSYALKSWLDIVRSREEKLKVFEFVKSELFKQTSFGDGFLSYYDFAKIHIESETLLNELKTLLEKRKDLWAAWSVNICQLVDMKRLDEASELAEQATTRFPLTYQLWYDLSLVHKIRGNTEEQITALKQALSINQNWSHAIQQLTEAFSLIGKNEEAKELLEDAIRRMPMDQYLHGYLADILWKLNEKENAVETVKKALKLDAEYDWGWNALKNWLREMRKADEVEKMAWQVALDKPRDVNSWLILAKILDEPQQAEKQFEAINQALTIDPYSIKGLALKVRNFLNRKLYDKALRVTQTVLPDGHRPELLRYYAAEIEFERENYSGGIQLLENLVSSSPHFYVAWERLAEIYRTIESKSADYLRVTKAMTNICPQEPTVFGYYGEACLFNDNRQDAKNAFRQAVALAPDYDFAACALFDLHFQDKERDQAFSALQNLKQFIKTPATTLRELQFNVVEGNRLEVRRLYRELCFDLAANRNHLDKAGMTITDAKLFDASVKFFDRSWKDFLKSPDVNENVGEIWVETNWKNGGKRQAEQSLDEVLLGSKAWRLAVKTHLETLTQDGKKYPIRDFVEAKSDVLKKDNEVWASVGYNLNCVKDYKTAMEWFADWQTRENLEPWMLWNYSLSLRRLGKNSEASLINQASLKLKNLEVDETSNLHLTMLGIENVTSGNISEAKKLAKKIKTEYLNSWGEYLYFLLTTVVDIFDSTNIDVKKRDALIQEMLKVSFSYQDFWKDNVIRKFFNESINKVLTLEMTKWQKTKIQMRIWSSYLSYLVNKNI